MSARLRAVALVAATGLALHGIDSVQVRAFDRDKSIFAAIALTPLVYLIPLSFTIPRDSAGPAANGP